MAMYQIRDIDHFYGDTQVLSVEDIAIPSGSITGLAGPNGSGKSTFLKLLGFMEEPTYGEILFNGKKALPFSDKVRFKVTLLTQAPFLLHRSVFDNVSYGLKIRGDTRDIKNRVHESLEQVGLSPDSFARRRWSALSGGEAQRVALAARLVLKPEVLLLDEPTASVDAHSARLIREASLRAREEWGTTIVVATHDWQWLYETCDSVLHMLYGRIFNAGLGCAVYGPWRIGQRNLLQKELEDGQLLEAPKPEEEKQVAVLDPSRLKITLPGKDPLLKWNTNMLNGIVSRLFLEKNDEMVQVAIKVAELVITIRMLSEKVEVLKLYPGREVCISYNPQEIEWY
ncbi:MAG: ATP-binding cassette domain-containing protein [Deltaproteobacteria bacterium]|jgi:tungstate transport system ATP-binding protein|nr:ATP-binding cassette domain-containing protein [Deltaproteobacteria bacterium]